MGSPVFWLSVIYSSLLFGCLFSLLDIRLREGSIQALPKTSLWLGSFPVYWCVEAILIKQKSKMLVGQVSRERRTSQQFCK